ncbi:hypothetical protein [Tenacibaculum caenipelagi]|uniref:Uncharacterized protein n=1 Tax=Tenacibaculum caenipelagi TaxID=1325435 RepID=A0A4R6TG36_9FLAO|nr:hypothetical protein [Tenacibaculum caenipelagi]TDQ27639.1 hypothetical protein DFQ07_1490 [Tenacibaculum caenipelagi]
MIQIKEKLERISTLIQKQLKDTEKTFKQAEPLANEFGYTFCKKTGKLLKQE